MTAPEAALRARIAAAGPIPFAAFMEEALYGSGGYYRRQALAIGPGGDFVTGSSLSPLFGGATAALVRRLDRALGRPADVLEVGCGGGAHLRALAAALAPGPARRLLAADRIPRPSEQPAESSVRWIPGPAAVEDLEGLVFSYELFDALPVHRVVGREHDEPGELWVALGEDGGFRWHTGELSRPELADILREAEVRLLPGQIADLAPSAAPLYRELARGLGRGLLVTCDYGFESANLFDPRVRRHGTLACHRRHTVHRDPFRHVGEQDLTAHVDFGRLRRVGEEEGLRTVAFTRQAPWLLACGLAAQLEGADDAVRRDAAHLLDGEGMGEAIRVLVQQRAIDDQALFAPEFRELWAPSRIANAS
jgi:SAM-dependent MidA family methyltransferase